MAWTREYAVWEGSECQKTRISFFKLQHKAQRLAEDFASAQGDAFADVEGGWDPEGGLSDDDTESEASWDDEAWNEPGA